MTPSTSESVSRQNTLSVLAPTAEKLPVGLLSPSNRGDEEERDDGHQIDGLGVNGDEEGQESGGEREPGENSGDSGGENDLDPYIDWDNGEPLTPEERAQIMKLSNYEKFHEMRMRYRRRLENELRSRAETNLQPQTSRHNQFE